MYPCDLPSSPCAWTQVEQKLKNIKPIAIVNPKLKIIRKRAFYLCSRRSSQFLNTRVAQQYLKVLFCQNTKDIQWKCKNISVVKVWEMVKIYAKIYIYDKLYLTISRQCQEKWMLNKIQSCFPKETLVLINKIYQCFSHYKSFVFDKSWTKLRQHSHHMIDQFVEVVCSRIYSWG